MLRWVSWEHAREERQDEALQDLTSWAQEGDGPVGFAVFRVLVRFWDRDDDGSFPDCWDG